MKTSIVLAALILNTTLLLAEPLSGLIQGVNPWVLLTSEVVLIIGYCSQRFLKDLRKTFDINIDDLKIFRF